ncbi:hypothetical protein TNCV_5021801 [Trichonephila clavipes]|nr:hypothetical protein TNCV_5021801 [Trichonephila clavipes]
MYAPSSSVNPTPLPHADTQRNVHPTGGISQREGTHLRTHCNQRRIDHAYQPPYFRAERGPSHLSSNPTWRITNNKHNPLLPI